MINGFGKRLKYQERWESPCFGQGVLFRSAPGAYQDSHSHTCRMSRFQVCQGITDANRLCQVQSMHLGCLQKQSGLGLATQTVILRSMWAHKRIIHSPACSVNLFQNSFMDQQGSFLIPLPTADWLVTRITLICAWERTANARSAPSINSTSSHRRT